MPQITDEDAGRQAVCQMLDLLAWSEGTSTSPVTKADGYDVIVTGVDGPEVFTDYAEHPFYPNRPAKLIRAVPRLLSTASGRYQLLERYWPIYKAQLHLPDFSPVSQDRIAIQQLRECGALQKILAQDIPGAIAKAATIWASLPGGPYGQGGHSLQTLMAKWAALAAAQQATESANV
jgi:muramidase (phage lysozyme)